jgi:hypothetical protein
VCNFKKLSGDIPSGTLKRDVREGRRVKGREETGSRREKR